MSHAFLSASRALREGALRFVTLTSLAALSAAVAGCAAQTSSSGAGGEGGTDEGGGGEGGEPDGDGGEGSLTTSTGPASACAQDCSTLKGLPACFEGKCNEQTGVCEVVASAAGAACDDGLFCTIDDACDDQGKCVGGGENKCGMTAEPCMAVACEESVQNCLLQKVPDFAPCASTDLCISNATCKAGVCEGDPKDCAFEPVPNDCHTAQCNPTTGQCEAVPKTDGADCKSDNLCLSSATCQAGQCTGGTEKDCSSKTKGCKQGYCETSTGLCKDKPIPQGDLCPLAGATDCFAGTCDAAGACVGKVVNVGGACKEGTDACNKGMCDASGACISTPTNPGGACDDGNTCTAGDKCTGGTCAGTPAPDYSVFFQDDFASNSKGWTFSPATGNDWEIGPAKVQTTTSFYNEDPPTDHTATNDNGLAGTVIGDNITKTIHDQHYLVSPEFDTASQAASGKTLVLEFWRWLNADTPSYTKCTIDVWDGASWVNVWSSSSNVKDAAWTKISHDVQTHANAKMRVRFGFAAKSGAFTVSGWNIDDVVVGSKACN